MSDETQMYLFIGGVALLSVGLVLLIFAPYYEAGKDLGAFIKKNRGEK